MPAKPPPVPTFPDDMTYVAGRAFATAKRDELAAEVIAGRVFSVASRSTLGQRHAVRPEPRDGLVFFSCTCKAGEFRAAYPIPCPHAAAVALQLLAMIPETIYQGPNGLIYPRKESS